MQAVQQQVIPIVLGMVRVFLIQGKGNILIDTGMPDMSGQIIGELKRHGLEPADISLIIATHNHVDHVGGLLKLKEETGAKVAIHRSEAEALRQGQSAEVKPVQPAAQAANRSFKSPSFAAVEPDLLIDDELSLDAFGIDGKVIHTPGHTPGSVTVLLSGGEAIVGDLFIGRQTETGSEAMFPMFATDLPGLKATLYKLVEYAPAIFYTSHGGTCSTEAVAKLAAQMEG